jgi:Peptidase M15
MATLSATQAKAMLEAIGFDNANRNFGLAVEGFQKGWNLGAALIVDGDWGPLTSAALATSYARHRKGQSTTSAHFSYSEFKCKDDGKFPECQRVWILRSHIRRLEVYRAKIGGPVRIVSGCRCTRHNQEVGGATASQHLFGAASDIEGRLTVQQEEALKLFAGLGFKQSTGKVVHVDSRDLSGHNLTHSLPTSPAVWQYAT